MKLQQILEGSILALLTLVVYLFTVNPLTKSYSLYALVACLGFSLILYLVSIRKGKKGEWRMHHQVLRILTFTFSTAILLWVGTTGWFLSPFFYLLYLLAISLAFLFSTSVAFSFILVIVAILLPTVGEIDPKFDLVTILSLLLTIPLAYFLSKTYLRVKEKEKKILILETEHKEYKTVVEEMLQNKVIRAAAELREPINDIRQLAYYAEHRYTKRDIEENTKKIIKLSEQALKLLNTFEEETTGEKFLKSPKSKK